MSSTGGVARCEAWLQCQANETAARVEAHEARRGGCVAKWTPEERRDLRLREAAMERLYFWLEALDRPSHTWADFGYQ